MAPERHERSSPEQEFDSSEIESGVRLMYLANEGDLKGINEALDSGIDVNFKDIDSRTALHVAACQGHPVVVELLLKRGAKVDAKDRWGSTVSKHFPVLLFFMYFKCKFSVFYSWFVMSIVATGVEFGREMVAMWLVFVLLTYKGH